MKPGAPDEADMPVPVVSARVDIKVIPDAAEAGAPGLREVARRFLEAETRHLGVPLDAASVMCRPGRGRAQVHITGRPADRSSTWRPPSLIRSTTGAPSRRWRASGRRR
jgi:hypothetical protein